MKEFFAHLFPRNRGIRIIPAILYSAIKFSHLVCGKASVCPL